jgi:hypothetical protein
MMFSFVGWDIFLACFLWILSLAYLLLWTGQVSVCCI